MVYKIKYNVLSDWEKYERKQNEIKQKTKQESYSKQFKNKPIPQLYHTDFILKKFSDSELTENELNLLSKDYSDLNRGKKIFEGKVANQFDFIMSGKQRKFLESQTYKHFDKSQDPKKLKIENENQQKHKKKIIEKTMKNFENGFLEIQKFEKQRLAKLGDKAGFSNLFDLNMVEGSIVTLKIKFNDYPKFSYVPLPVSLNLKHPIYTNDALIIVENKQRKKQIKQILKEKILDFDFKIIHLEKYKKRLEKTVRLRNDFLSIYDFIFVDHQIKHLIYSLEDKFYDEFYHPILLPKNTEKWTNYIQSFFEGTPIHIPRGTGFRNIRIALTVMKKSEVVENFLEVMNSLQKYLPGGYKNILEMSIKSSKSPELPIYFDKNLFLGSLKKSKQFKIEQDFVEPKKKMEEEDEEEEEEEEDDDEDDDDEDDDDEDEN